MNKKLQSSWNGDRLFLIYGAFAVGRFLQRELALSRRIISCSSLLATTRARAQELFCIRGGTTTRSREEQHADDFAPIVVFR
jgi:hypothetical protein